MSRRTNHRSNGSKTELIKIRENGNIKTVSMKTVSTKPVPTNIEQTDEYKKFAKLKGKKIGVAEAGRKYDITFATISRWKDRGFIPVLGSEGKQKLLLDESYVAYCAFVYKQNPGAGKTPFNKDGTPFVSKTIKTNGNGNGKH